MPFHREILVIICYSTDTTPLLIRIAPLELIDIDRIGLRLLTRFRRGRVPLT